MVDKLIFLPRDYRKLEAEIAETDARYQQALGGIGATADISSETWHDNPAFDDQQQQAKMAHNRLRQLQDLRNRAEIITELPAGETAETGCRVRFRRSDFPGEEDEVVLGSYFISDSADDEVSTSSPLGMLLLGTKAGDEVKGEIGGRRVTITIVAVSVAAEYFE